MDPLVSAEELGDYLQRPVPPAAAALAVAGASGIVRAYCQWDITAQDAITFTVTGTGSRVVGLATLHLRDVTSVTVDDVLIDPGDYRWSARGQLYNLSTAWPRWSTIDVVVDAGYDDPPDVVKIVALSLASRYLSNPHGLKAATVGAVQQTYAGPELNSLELALLDCYRLG